MYALEEPESKLAAPRFVDGLVGDTPVTHSVSVTKRRPAALAAATMSPNWLVSLLYR